MLPYGARKRCMMKEDTVKLLKAVESGCYMAVNSFKQFEEYELKEDLTALFEQYKDKHLEIQRQATDLLCKYSDGETKHNNFSAAMSLLSTEMKMLMNNTSAQAAKLMMDGCNMGIQTVSENLSKYGGADKEADDLAKRLIAMEEEFMSKLKLFL